MIVTKSIIGKTFNMRKSIIGKIILLFALMFVLLLTPVIVQSVTSFRQAQTYGEVLSNIIYANQLNLDVGEKIDPLVWNIVAGKESFESSGIMELVSDIRSTMFDIRNSTDSIDNRIIMEMSIRALSTLESYLERLNAQIENRDPVEENEILLEEIRGCVAVINDLLLEFSSKQVEEAAVLNQAMTRQSNLNLILNISLTLVVVVVGGFAFIYISRSLMNPIRELLNMSNKISEGDFSSRTKLSTSDEFSNLAAGMNTMSERIEILLEKSIVEQKQLQKMEHKILQAQIRPHFLYNTLDAIIWAAEADDKASVITLVESLSSFFRISLSHGIDFIPIHDEIEHVHNYLIIQQVRYSDVLTYEINVDEDIPNRKILKLLLQPLVENALYHGIKNTRERGKIIVSVKKEGEKLRFTVTDNGVGMTEEALEELIYEINHGNGEKGYGLFNVNKRLKLYYDLSEGVEIKSEYRKGTEVSFVLDLGENNV